MSARIGPNLAGAQTFKFIRDKTFGQRPPVCSIISYARPEWSSEQRRTDPDHRYSSWATICGFKFRLQNQVNLILSDGSWWRFPGLALTAFIFHATAIDD